MILRVDPPSETQARFLKCKVKHIGYGGARGGGKSWAVRTKAKLLAVRFPGIRILIVRRTYPELINNHINTLRKELLEIAKYNDKDKVLKFDNGSEINFRYCDKDKDLDRLQGVEYDVVFLDEATQLSEHQMKVIVACVRGVNSFPKRVYYTFNPGGQGHAYIKRVFIDRKFEGKEKPEDFVFIQSLVTDNKVLMESQPEYIEQLEALPPKLKKAWLYGEWDVFDGQFFEDFVDKPEHYDDKRYTHVINPFDIPSEWRIYRSFDWGYNKPFSVGWWAVDYDGVVYRILELYGCTETPNEGVKWSPPQVFSEVQKIETSHPWLKGKRISGVADPAIWNAQTGKSISDFAGDYSVFFDKGDNERVAGWIQMHYRFQFDENGYPMMYVFKNCKAFIRTIPLLQYDRVIVEDLDSTGEDHVADETRYFLMSRPIAPRRAREANNYAYNPLSYALDIPQDMLGDAPIRTDFNVQIK